MEIVILGSGTSGGIPEPGCTCSVCTSTDPKDRRYRSSLLIRNGEQRIVIDTATEFRLQAIRERISRIDAVLVTHDHADHISGMDDLRNFTWHSPVPVYANEPTLAGIRERFSYFFKETQRGGGKPKVVLNRVTGPFTAAGRDWIPLPALHGKLDVLGYRTGQMAYLTDASEIPAETLTLMEDLEILVIGALRYKPHETHMTVSQALELIARIKPKRAYLTHLCHDISHRRLEKELPSGVFPAWDGLTLTVGE